MRSSLLWSSVMWLAAAALPVGALAQDAPSIVTPPQGQSVSSGASVTFSVLAAGTEPLSYRWRFNGAALANATNASLSLSNVNLLRAGAYTVVITNNFGAVTSEVATLSLDEDLTFRILELRTNGAIILEVGTITGDDRGGMAIGGTNVFLTGDERTGRWGLDRLLGGAALSNRFDALTTDLRTETAYSLGNGSTTISNNSGTVTTLIPIDGNTGLLSGESIALSTNISFTSTPGIFAGYGRVVLHNGSRVYSIAVPSGAVTDLGPMASFTRRGSESWAYWGVAEYIGNAVYLAYVQDQQTIVRRRVPDGAVSIVGRFTNLADMASFTFSPSFGRWYFHYENLGQFGGSDETLGSAKALFTTEPAYPFIVRDPASVNTYPGSNATFRVAASGGPPLAYQWRFNGADLDGATSDTLVITNAQAADAGAYSVRIENPVAAVVSAEATLAVLTAPLILSDPIDRSAFPGQNATFNVLADGAPPLSYQWFFNGVAVSDGTNSVLLLTNVQTSDEGGYNAQITNLYGETNSATAFLTVITAPEITFQPQDVTVVSGTNALFDVSVSGAPPLSYQWFFNGAELAGATDSFLFLTNVQAGDAGLYSVRVTNVYGSALSSNATLNVIVIVDDGSVFQIASLTTNGARAVSANITGDDRGGMAVSTNLVLLTGDNGTARFSAVDLSGGALVGRVVDSLCSNLRTERIYGLSDGTNLIPFGGGTIAVLFELNPTTGAPTGTRINLSRPITATRFNDQVGIFSGYDEIVIYAYPRTFRIALPSGQVTELGSQNLFSHFPSESWAFWGVAEHAGGYTYVVYAVPDQQSFIAQTIVRTRLPDGLTTTLFSTAGSTLGLADMASFTVSVPRQRWYFHHENGSVFRSGDVDETIGYANATFAVNSGPKADHFEWGPLPPLQVINAPFTVTLAARNTAGATVTNYSGVVALAGLLTNGAQAVVISPVTVSNFVNGVWTGQVTVQQAAAAMFLRADDRAGTAGNSAVFSVAPANDLVVLAANSPNPALAANPLTYSILVTNTGPSPASGVRLTNTLPANAVFVSANASQGECTNLGNVVICQLGTVSTGAVVHISVVPPTPGSLTNRAVVARNEVDANTTNNTFVLVTPVVLPSLNIGDVSVSEGASGTNDAVFLVTLSGPTTNVVSVAFATGGGNASSSGTIPDYVARFGVLVFPSGVTTQTLAVGIRGDTLYEFNDTFFLTLSSPTNAMLARNQGACVIFNDDDAPIVSVQDTGVIEGNAGPTNASFRVTLSAQSGLLVPVFFTTSNGTATAGSDFTNRTSFVSFPAGTTNLTQNALIAVTGDTLAESNEVFYLRITGVSNAVIGRAVAACTITNDDGSNVLDHFAFAPVATPQRPGALIPVTLAAKDFFDATMTNFNGTVNLSGLAGGGGADTNIFGGAAFTNMGFGDYTIGYAFTPKTNLTVTHIRHYCGKVITLWTDKGDVLFSQAVASTDGTWLETPLPTPVPLTGGERYRLAFYTGGTNANFFYDFNLGTNFEHIVLNTGVFGFGDSFPTNATITGWAVDLRYLAGTPDFPVAVTPPVTGNFTNGVWSGAVQVSESTTNLVLQAGDNQQHRGASNPFDVVEPTTTDLALSAVASAGAVFVDGSVTFTIAVTNRGREAAFGLVVTAQLPAGLNFVSATAGAESCANEGDRVICRIRSLKNNAGLTIALIANVNAPGPATNEFNVSFAGADTVLENNSATVITMAFIDSDGDGMPDEWESLYSLDPRDPSDAAQDPDGDQVTNLGEFQAGTNPRDPASFIRIVGIQMVDGDVRIRFHGVAGRRFQLEYSDTMAPMDWHPLVAFRIGRLLEAELIDTGAIVPGRMYRVRQLPPGL